MKGDFSRLTFDAAKHFSRVLMQQGRVQLDADWNEQSAILLHYVQTLAKDLMGAHAGPALAAERGFKIDKATTNAATDFMIGAGRYYVDGLLCELEQAMTYLTQKDYPRAEPLDAGKPYVAYLDVWERHVSFIEESNAAIREVALGGPDTATRAKVMCQVKVLAGATSCDAINALQRTDLPKLRTRVKPGEVSTDPCIQPPDAKYRGAENQLYRVEIHLGGNDPAATFKWSRDNGSVVFAIDSARTNGTVVGLQSLGRDASTSLDEGNWVEVLDEAHLLRGGAGSLLRVEAVDRDEFTVTLSAAPVLSANARPVLLRRWDSDDAIPVSNAEGTWLELEDGVQVQFEPGKSFRVGDYWMIPARTITGGVEWPYALGADGKPAQDADGALSRIALEPGGVQHHFAPLAVLSHNGGEWQAKQDCRCTINALITCP